MGSDETPGLPPPPNEEVADAGASFNIDFVTFGMFIIDEIEYLPPKPPVKDILGGGGSYSALGARLFSPPPLSSTVSWIVDQGSDFPPPIATLIDSWQTSVVIRSDPSRLTTRGWNGYVDATGKRAFRYTTPKKRLEAADLTPALLQSRAFHIISSPTRCRDLVTELLSRRRAECPADVAYARPLIIWEPVPDLCTPDELLNCTNTLPFVDICSPNHAELAGFMGDDGLDPVTGDISTAAVERACEQLLGSMPLSSFTLVVRAGDKGCYLARNGGRRRVSKTGVSASAAGGAPAAPKRRRKAPLIHGGLQPDTDMEALFAGLLQDEDGAIAREEIEADPGIERWIPAYYQQTEGARKEPTERDGPAANGPEIEAVGPVDQGSMQAEGQVADGQDDGDWEDEDDDDQTEAEAEADEVTGTGPEPPDLEAESSVVDPTGGGNTFLGGLAIALARGKSVEEAAIWGTIAASFAIEQVGVPELGTDADGDETWNGVRVEDRLQEFRERIGAL